MSKLPVLALSMASVVGMATSSPAALQSPDEYCSVSKLKSTSLALECYLRSHIKLAAGGSADPSDCSEKLASRFAKAEGRGGCLTAGDNATAAVRAEQTATDILDAMGTSLVTDKAGLACLKRKAKLVSRYARCQSSALSLRVYGTYQGIRDDFGECRANFQADFAEIDATGDCPSTGEAAEVEELAPGGFAFLPSVAIRYQNLDGAPLSHAYLVGADFYTVSGKGASFRGADLTNSSIYNVTMSSVSPSDFRDANFDGAEVIGIDFENSLFDGAELANAELLSISSHDLSDCPASLPFGWTCVWGYLMGPTAHVYGLDLSGLDVSGMSFPGVDFHSLDLTSAIVHGVDFTDASFSYVYLDGADLAGTDLSVASLSTPVQSAPLVACPAALPGSLQCFHEYIIGPDTRLTGVDFSGEDLSGSYLYGWELAGCNLSGANLSGTTQVSARFTDCDLTGADVTGAYLYASYWTNTICPDGTNSNANGNTCCGHFVGGAPASCSSY